jgi:hypothetical protein
MVEKYIQETAPIQFLRQACHGTVTSQLWSMVVVSNGSDVRNCRDWCCLRPCQIPQTHRFGQEARPACQVPGR